MTSLKLANQKSFEPGLYHDKSAVRLEKLASGVVARLIFRAVNANVIVPGTCVCYTWLVYISINIVEITNLKIH